MRILLLRMLGLGDVTAIGVPAARVLRRRHPDARLEFLTLGAGREVIELVPEVDEALSIGRDDWPDELLPALRSFAGIADALRSRAYDLVVNLDTWFMPCALTRMLRDAGTRVEGNHLRWSVSELLDRVSAGTLEAKHVRYPSEYLVSTYPAMSQWHSRWWDAEPEAGPYPRFYMERCCGFSGPFDGELDVPSDFTHRDAAGDKPVVAVALSGRTRSRSYPHAKDLVSALEAAGAHVWSRFDGSQPMRATLGQLRETDLLVSVASAPQWLAQSVGCRTLVLPGHVPPPALRATKTMSAHLECQFCMALECVEVRDYACLDVPAQRVADEAMRMLDERATPHAAA